MHVPKKILEVRETFDFASFQNAPNSVFEFRDRRDVSWSSIALHRADDSLGGMFDVKLLSSRV
jgi:hypothetical protein